MITVHIRKQGGAAVKMLNISIGEELELDVTNEGFIAHPTHKGNRKRYTIEELLNGITKKELEALNKESKWARTGKAVGRETD